MCFGVKPSPFVFPTIILNKSISIIIHETSFTQHREATMAAFFRAGTEKKTTFWSFFVC